MQNFHIYFFKWCSWWFRYFYSYLYYWEKFYCSFTEDVLLNKWFPWHLAVYITDLVLFFPLNTEIVGNNFWTSITNANKVDGCIIFIVCYCCRVRIRISMLWYGISWLIEVWLKVEWWFSKSRPHNYMSVDHCRTPSKCKSVSFLQI